MKEKKAMVADSGEGSSQVELEMGSRRDFVDAWENEIRELAQVEPMARPVGLYHLRGPSIPKVYPHLRKQDPDAYEPKLVSIGPLHRGKIHLLPMEQKKLDYLHSILKVRAGILNILFDAVLNCLNLAKQEYSEKSTLSDYEFARMLVIDGCFICRFSEEKRIAGITPVTQKDVDALIVRDLLLLENQIPFFVVRKLLMILRPPEPEPNSFEGSLCCEYFCRQLMVIELPSYDIPFTQPVFDVGVGHLLHLMHRCTCLPVNSRNEPPRRFYYSVRKLIRIIFMPFLGLFYLILIRDCSGLFNAHKKPWDVEMIPSATELIDAGIKFQAAEFPEYSRKAHQLRVSFSDGVLEIPWFRVDDTQYHSLRNLIALEQHFNNIPPLYTSYCMFLDNLINSAEDVAILRRSGILQNLLGDDSEVAHLFNGLCKNIFMNFNGHSYRSLYKEVTTYCEVPHHRWRANLVQKYFSNPWTSISVIAAVIIIVFTVTQTIVTIYPRK